MKIKKKKKLGRVINLDDNNNNNNHNKPQPKIKARIDENGQLIVSNVPRQPPTDTLPTPQTLRNQVNKRK